MWSESHHTVAHPEPAEVEDDVSHLETPSMSPTKANKVKNYFVVGYIDTSTRYAEF